MKQFKLTCALWQKSVCFSKYFTDRILTERIKCFSLKTVWFILYDYLPVKSVIFKGKILPKTIHMNRRFPHTAIKTITLKTELHASCIHHVMEVEEDPEPLPLDGSLSVVFLIM